MLHEFQTFIAQNQLVVSRETTLIAVSGGVDSVVLCRLFDLAKLPIAIAHCNFQLRGLESDKDEAFVEALAKKAGVAFFSTRFDTADFAIKNRLSIQEAARKLRYDWLNKVAQEVDCQRIATAHHLDDSIETVLYNFAKGCGLRGLHGILPKTGNLIRPLLFATKRQVLAFATVEILAYREDASNLKDTYNRNKIRHHVTPVFEDINPGFQASAADTIERLREAEALFDFALRTLLEGMIEKSGDLLKMDAARLLSSPAPATVLYEWLKPFGFNRFQVKNILQSIENQPGSVFETPDFQLWTDRGRLVLAPVKASEKTQHLVSEQNAPLTLEDGVFTISMKEEAPAEFPSDPFTACLDATTLKFPLTLRRWRDGDVFRPLGMGGKHQKLQDFFSNQKLSVPEKERVWLLESGGEICWVVGFRPDERYKVGEETTRCLVAQFKPGTFAA